MAEFNINNLIGGRAPATPSSSANFDSLVNLARSQIDKLSQQVQSLVNQQSASRTVTPEQGAIRVQIPQLANFISGQQEVLLKTAFPLDRNQNINVQVQQQNVVLKDGRPVLQLQGQISQPNVQVANPQLQRFTADIPLQNLNTQATQNITTQQTGDQVVRNFLPVNNVNAFTGNLSETTRPLLPQTLQNLNLNTQNSFNIQINSLVTPTGQQLVQLPTGQPQTQPLPQGQVPTNVPNATNPAQPVQTQQQPGQPALQNLIIRGQVEIFPEAKEALIRTELGSFRVPNLANVPNGSQVQFTITGPATTQTQPTANPANTLLNLNPTNLQALRLTLEAADSPLQNLLRLLNSSQALAANVQRFFPHPDDKAAYVRQLMFLSGSATGNPEGWLGEDGQLLINRLHESDATFGRLRDVFGMLRNFIGRGDQPVNLEWNSYMIPFYDGNKLSFVTVQVQRDPDGDPQNFKGKRKFVLELEQDALGRIAIEGLYAGNRGKVNSMDVVLKTENPVDDSFMDELTGIFNETAIAYGFTGTLSFARYGGGTPLYTDISKILGDGIVI